jgi:hypothetical protein
MKTLAKGVGIFLALTAPPVAVAVHSDRVNMHYHTRSIRERAEARSRIEALEKRVGALEGKAK